MNEVSDDHPIDAPSQAVALLNTHHEPSSKVSGHDEPLLPCGLGLNNVTLDDLQKYSEAHLKQFIDSCSKALQTKKLDTSQRRSTLKSDRETSTPAKTKSSKVQKTGSLSCEVDRCKAKFIRSKDKKRHFRNKHGDAPKHHCPVIGCRQGNGHVIERADKLREHLALKSSPSYTWRCLIDGCAVQAEGKDCMAEHMKQHDYLTRYDARQKLRDYGFQSTGYYHYYHIDLAARHMCTVKMCPFGAHSIEQINQHVVIAHNGALFSCPIYECSVTCHDWKSATEHLARDHSYDSRITLANSEGNYTHGGYRLHSCLVNCPLCQKQLHGYYYSEQLKRHFQSHSLEQVRLNSSHVVEVYKHAMGRSIGYLKTNASDLEIFSFVTEGMEDRQNIE